MPDKKNTIYYINTVITILVMFSGWILPEVAGLTRLGMQATGIFFGFLWGWSTVGMIWPSLLGLVAIGLTGFMKMNAVFGAAFGSSLTIQIFAMFVFVYYMEKTGLSEYIARKIMSLKFAHGKPWLLTLLIMVVALVISALTAGTFGILIAWEIYYPILKLCGYTKQDAYTNCVLFGIGIGGMVGAICFPYQSMSLVYTQAYETAMNTQINPLPFFLARFPISLLLVVALWATIRWVVRPDISKLKNQTDAVSELMANAQIKLSKEGKVAAFAIGLFLFGLFAPGSLPKTWPLIGTLSKLGLVGIASIIFVVLSIVRLKTDKGYKPAMDMAELIKMMNWNLIFIMSVTTPITNMLQSDEAKIFDLFISFLTPLTESLGPMAFIVVVIIFCGAVTQVSHNMILAAVVVPIIIPLAQAIGVDPLAMVLAIMMPIQVAICTPAASGNAAVIWGNTEWIDTKMLFKLCILTFILIVIFSVITMPYFMLLFN